MSQMFLCNFKIWPTSVVFQNCDNLPLTPALALMKKRNDEVKSGLLRSMPTVFTSGFRTPSFGLQRETWRSPFRNHRNEEEHWCYAGNPRWWHHQCCNNSHIFKYVNVTVINRTGEKRGFSCLQTINIYQQWCYTWKIRLLIYAWFKGVIERWDGLSLNFKGQMFILPTV